MLDFGASEAEANVLRAMADPTAVIAWSCRGIKPVPDLTMVIDVTLYNMLFYHCRLQTNWNMGKSAVCLYVSLLTHCSDLQCCLIWEERCKVVKDCRIGN